jgi:hypothetical protein
MKMHVLLCNKDLGGDERGQPAETWQDSSEDEMGRTMEDACFSWIKHPTSVKK